VNSMIFIVAAVPPAPAAYVSRVSHRSPCSTLVACGVPHPDRDESPSEPDHDYLEGHLWVNTITGGPNELSPLPQITFITPQLTPLRKLEVVPDFSLKAKAQTRALGAVRHAPSRMRGRS